MKCVSCEIEINPKWSHAISINVCPFCGKHIMEEHLKNLFASLSETMGQLQQYTNQLDDWLLSNYNYIKTDSPDLKLYLPKEAVRELKQELDEQELQDKKTTTVKIKLPGGGEEEITVEKPQSEAKTNSFFERAEVLKGSGKTSGKSVDGSEPHKSVAEKTQYLKERVQQIQAAASQGLTGEAGEVSLISPEMLEHADPEAVAELQAVIDGGDIVASGLPVASVGDDDAIMNDRVLANNLRIAQKKGGQNSQEADLKKIQGIQGQVANAQKRMGTGGFSRS
jgi:hypothetical protein